MAEPDGARNGADCDVLIVGAGPAGMAAALGAQAAGLSVRLVEKHAARLPYSRALLVNPHVLDALTPYGVAERIEARGEAVASLALRDGERALLHAEVRPAPGERPAVVLPQLETESCFEAALAERGLKIERPVEWLDFRETGDGVVSRLRGPAGETEIRSRWLIGADGYRSQARAGAGLAFPQRDFPQKLEVADIRLVWPWPENVCLWIGAAGFVFGVRLGAGVARFAGTDLESRLGAIAEMPAAREILWDSAFDVHFAVAEAAGRGRLWLAGDALHVHSPAGGRGMNMGIMDGLTLGPALAGGDPEAWGRERLAAARKWVRLNRWITQAALGPGAPPRLALARRLASLAERIDGQGVGRLLYRNVIGL